MKPELTQEELRRVLHYAPETGLFTWRVRLSIRIVVGKRAGAKMVIGYTSIGIYGRDYLAHRLAWFYMTGVWPPDDIDHINGIRNDNRWCNLRPATRQQNMQNKRKLDANTSGIKGVSWDKLNKKWFTQVTRPDGTKFFARYSSKDEAAAAYAREATKAHGEFARLD